MMTVFAAVNATGGRKLMPNCARALALASVTRSEKRTARSPRYTVRPREIQLVSLRSSAAVAIPARASLVVLLLGASVKLTTWCSSWKRSGKPSTALPLAASHA